MKKSGDTSTLTIARSYVLIVPLLLSLSVDSNTSLFGHRSGRYHRNSRSAPPSPPPQVDCQTIGWASILGAASMILSCADPFLDGERLKPPGFVYI